MNAWCKYMKGDNVSALRVVCYRGQTLRFWEQMPQTEWDEAVASEVTSKGCEDTLGAAEVGPMSEASTSARTSQRAQSVCSGTRAATDASGDGEPGIGPAAKSAAEDEETKSTIIKAEHNFLSPSQSADARDQGDAEDGVALSGSKGTTIYGKPVSREQIVDAAAQLCMSIDGAFVENNSELDRLVRTVPTVRAVLSLPITLHGWGLTAPFFQATALELSPTKLAHGKSGPRRVADIRDRLRKTLRQILASGSSDSTVDHRWEAAIEGGYCLAEPVSLRDGKASFEPATAKRPVGPGTMEGTEGSGLCAAGEETQARGVKRRRSQGEKENAGEPGSERCKGQSSEGQVRQELEPPGAPLGRPSSAYPSCGDPGARPLEDELQENELHPLEERRRTIAELQQQIKELQQQIEELEDDQCRLRTSLGDSTIQQGLEREFKDLFVW